MFWPDGRRKEVALRMRDVSGQWMTASNPFKLTTIGTVVLATSAEDEVRLWVGGWVGFVGLSRLEHLVFGKG